MPLILPVCSFDAKAGLLCPVCEAKLKEGRITSADVLASRALVRYAEHSRALESVALFHSYSADGDFLLEVNESAVPVLRSEPVKAELERLIGGRFWVTASASSNRRLVEDLMHPLTVSQMSTLWLPDGSKVSKVVVSPERRIGGRRLTAVQKLAKAARGIDLLIDQATREHGSDAPFEGRAEAVSVAALAR